MLPKQYRLKKNSEFIATYAQKKYVANNYFSLNIGKQKPFPDFISKVAFVVSKKIDKRAVVRNSIKRKMRHAFYEILQETNFQIKYMSLIFVARKNTYDLSFKSIKNEMLYLLNKANLKYD